MTTPTELQIASLDREISELGAAIRQLRIKRRAAVKSLLLTTIRRAYLQAAHVIRSPARRIVAWPILLFAVAPIAIGALMLIVVNEAVASWEYAGYSFVAGTLVCLATCTLLMYLPSNTRLPALLAESVTRRRNETGRLAELRLKIEATSRRFASATSLRQQLVVSDRLKREALLKRNWKAMRDDEWEEFLVEVCEALGAIVKRTGRSGDQGVDLIAEFGPRRIAIQAKGYYHAVNGSAVQEAVAGVAFYGCTESAVITNSRFTKGARELAVSNRCILIGEAEFPSFVLGTFQL